MPRVIDIQHRHMELGRIRLGEKGSKGQPQRLDTWRLTSASRALMDSAAAVYGGTVEEWTDAPDKGYYQLTTDTAELDVMVPPGDAYSQYYELWSGGGCKRRCDGVTELLTGSPCKCDADERECKITTRINVMLPRVAGLGVWRLESHGYYAAAELPDMLELLQQVGGGRLVSGVLRIEQRSSKRNGQTKRFPVPVLDLPNVTLASLTGNQIVVNPPALLETGKPSLVGTAALPADNAFDNGTPGFGTQPALPKQPQDGERDSLVATSARTRPAARTKGEALDRLMSAAKARGMNFARVDAIAKEMGIVRGAASVEELLRLLERIETPLSGVPTAPASRGGEERSDLPVTHSTVEADDPAEPKPDDPQAATGTSPSSSSPAASTDTEQDSGGAASPPASSEPAPAHDPDTLRTLAAAVLGLDATEKWTLNELTDADFAQVWDALNLSTPAAYRAWYTKQERPVRTVLMAAHQSPKHREDRAKQQPDAEQLQAALGLTVNEEAKE